MKSAQLAKFISLKKHLLVIGEGEEIRWLREEKRWLREEQRWIREESRWRSERESLIREIAALRIKFEALERGKLLDAPIGGISEVGGGDRSLELAEETDVEEMILEARVSEEREGSRWEKGKEEVKEMIVEEEVRIRVSDEEIREEMERTKEKVRRTLRKGSEGEDVRALQDGTNGAATALMAEITEIKETIIKETGDAEVEVSRHRAFLLGENRWEEPSRLKGRDKPISESKVVSCTKCLTCRGEVRLMCTECDGIGCNDPISGDP